MNSPDIILTRTLLTPEEMYGDLAGAGSSEPSVGLCYLGAVLRERGFSVEIIDAVALGLTCEDLAEMILRRSPRYVGISSVTISIHNSGKLATLVKQQSNSIITIVGGVHITAVPVETMEMFQDIDIGILGEGEITIVELLETLESGGDLSQVQGIIFREGRKLRITERRAFIRDLDTLPLPAWDLLPDLHQYYGPPAWSLNRRHSALIITSRGCSGKCIYCDRGCFGSVCRAHSADYVMSMMMDLYHNYGVTNFRINDDNFLLFRRRLRDLCNRIEKEHLDITWSCFARADSVNLDLLRMMKRSGCWQISYGVETGSQEIHDVERKRISLETIENAIRWTKLIGIRTIGFCMIGHPKESQRTIRATIDFAKRLDLDDFKMVYLTPYPSTELYAHADKYGTLDRDWRKMNAYQAPCFVPYGLTKDDLVKWRRRAYIEFYFRPKIVLSYLKAIKGFDYFQTLLKGFLALAKLCISHSPPMKSKNISVNHTEEKSRRSLISG